MRLAARDIANHPRLAACVREQAATLLAIQQAAPRTASIFATQQRWLMAHLALALYFRGGADEGASLRATRFHDEVLARRVASRNTADAFLKEMRHYGYLREAPVGGDRRARPLEPTDTSLEAISGWLAVHLHTLDGLDDGARRTAFAARPESIARIHPGIAEGLLGSPLIRDPDPTFSLFTWLNEGGIVMDWLYAGLAEVPRNAPRIPSTVASFADIGERVHLSRSHLTRKLRMAEAMGSLGWLGARGKSTMWVSADFVQQYHNQQAEKLAIVDAAFHEVFVSKSPPIEPNKSQSRGFAGNCDPFESDVA